MKKVLIAEDDALLATILKERFETEGFEVKTVSNGESAISETLSWQPDLLMLDVLMPSKNGFEVLEVIKGKAEVGHMRTIVITNLGDDESMKKAGAFGVADFFVKALTTPEEISARAHQLLADELGAVH